MSDNTLLNVGTGGDTIRDIDRGTGSKTQVVQLDAGGSNLGAEQLVSQTNPLPIFDATSADLLRQILACCRAQVMILNSIGSTAINPSDFMDDSSSL